MAGRFEGITKKFIKQVAEGMTEDDGKFLNIPFDEFKELTRYDGDALSIASITQSVTIRMNEVGPANWYFKVGYKDGGRVVHISRERKEAYNLE